MDGMGKRVVQRFGGFALGHFGLSLGCTGLLFVLVLGWAVIEPLLPQCSGLWSLCMAWLLAAVLMAAYYPVGYGMARSRGWTRAEGREERLAVLLPALVAWAWGGLGTGLLFLGDDPAALQGAWFLVAGAFFLAMPSWYFMALCTYYGVIGPLPQGGSWGPLLLCLLLAGLLPPLLFHLGAQRAARIDLSGDWPGKKGDIP